jgi:hypothetical protein
MRLPRRRQGARKHRNVVVGPVPIEAAGLRRSGAVQLAQLHERGSQPSVPCIGKPSAPRRHDVRNPAALPGGLAKSAGQG